MVSRSLIYTSVDQIHLLEFTTVSEDSDILLHKNLFSGSSFLIMSNFRQSIRTLENSDGSRS